MPCGEIPVCWISSFVESANPEMPCGEVPVLQFCSISNSPAPNMLRVQSSTFIVVSCPNLVGTCELGMRLVLSNHLKLSVWRINSVCRTYWGGGGGFLQLWCQRWHHSCRENFVNLQKAAKQKNCCLQYVLSVNQKIFLWIRKSTKLEPYHMA